MVCLLTLAAAAAAAAVGALVVALQETLLVSLAECLRLLSQQAAAKHAPAVVDTCMVS